MQKIWANLLEWSIVQSLRVNSQGMYANTMSSSQKMIYCARYMSQTSWNDLVVDGKTDDLDKVQYMYRSSGDDLECKVLSNPQRKIYVVYV